MAEQLLDGADVVAILEQVRGRGMAERVAGDAAGHAGRARRFRYRALQGGLVEVMAAALTGGGVQVRASGREDALGKLARGVRQLRGERAGQRHPTGALLQVRLV